jgi:hypothetical protein
MPFSLLLVSLHTLPSLCSECSEARQGVCGSLRKKWRKKKNTNWTKSGKCNQTRLLGCVRQRCLSIEERKQVCVILDNIIGYLPPSSFPLSFVISRHNNKGEKIFLAVEVYVRESEREGREQRKMWGLPLDLSMLWRVCYTRLDTHNKHTHRCK